MKRSILFLFAALTTFMLVGCGDAVEVPPAYVGKLSTESGLQEGIISPSKLRLEGMCRVCDSLILAEASDFETKESMKIFMPKDQLNLSVDVRGVYSISAEQANVEKIFARIPAQKSNGSSRVSFIPMSKVYQTYAKQAIRNATRTVITRYQILQIMENREAIGIELAGVVRKALSSTPITITQFGLADIQPPKVVVDAQESRKKKEIEIEEAKADKRVRLTTAEGDLEVAKKQRQVDLQEAGTQVLVAKQLAKGVSAAWLKQRALKVLEKMTQSPNKVFFLPMEAMKNPALLLGGMMEAQRGEMVASVNLEPESEALPKTNSIERR